MMSKVRFAGFLTRSWLRKLSHHPASGENGELRAGAPAYLFQFSESLAAI